MVLCLVKAEFFFYSVKKIGHGTFHHRLLSKNSKTSFFINFNRIAFYWLLYYAPTAYILQLNRANLFWPVWDNPLFLTFSFLGSLTLICHCYILSTVDWWLIFIWLSHAKLFQRKRFRIFRRHFMVVDELPRRWSGCAQCHVCSFLKAINFARNSINL